MPEQDQAHRRGQQHLAQRACLEAELFLAGKLSRLFVEYLVELFDLGLARMRQTRSAAGVTGLSAVSAPSTQFC
jgi:hypothetical protein